MERDDVRAYLTQQWADAFEGTIAPVLGERPEITSQALDRPRWPDDEAWEWSSQDLGFGPEASVWVGAAGPSWRALGQAALHGVGLESAGVDAERAACRELFAQAGAALAERVAAQTRMAAACRDMSAAAKPAESAGMLLCIQRPSSPEDIEVILVFSERLLRRLSELLDTAPAAAPAALPVERIADLQFSVYAVLGRTDLLLGDIFKLTIGSVIEIGQRVSDPVDVAVNGKVIAQGQVVACDGNYGVRVLSKGSQAGRRGSV